MDFADLGKAIAWHYCRLEIENLSCFWQRWFCCQSAVYTQSAVCILYWPLYKYTTRVKELTVCRTYEAFYLNGPPIPTRLLEQAPEKLPTVMYGTAMDTNMAVAFANIFLSKVETEILSQSTLKPLLLETLYRQHILESCDYLNNHNYKDEDNRPQTQCPTKGASETSWMFSRW